ncbi:hypothetical protein J6590_090092, partial [Homalodisca vitripennis]
ITQGTFYEIKNSPVPGFWPDIKPSDIITKRAQLALLLHNNNLSALTPDTAAELMYQVPAPILTHARPESPISVSSDTVAAAITPVRHTEDLNLHKTPQNCTCNQEKNTQEENWSEVKKKNRNSKKQKKKVQDLTVIPLSNKYEALNTKEYDTKVINLAINKKNYEKQIKPRKTSISKPTPTGKEINCACSKGKIKVSGLVMPGATTEQVYKQAEGALSRPTVIIVGTNNITKKSTGEIYTNLESNLQSLSTQRTVHITTIPYRYDVNTIDPTHNEIDIVNNYIKEIAVRMVNVSIIDSEELKRDHFTRHGLHLNYHGESEIQSKSCLVRGSTDMDASKYTCEDQGNVELEHYLLAGVMNMEGGLTNLEKNIVANKVRWMIQRHSTDINAWYDRDYRRKGYSI